MSEKLWGGRFEKEIDYEVLLYTLTTNIDARMAEHDIWGSIAHLLMLHHQDIVGRDDAIAILTVLLSLLDDAQNGSLRLDPALEDIHFNIESQVIARTSPEIGGRLHTARSRNDQVVTDTRMLLRWSILDLKIALHNFITDLLMIANDNLETIAVGYTHVQPAQPISLGYWLTCYASMYLRDLHRLSESYHITNQSVLGACALAGTSFNINRDISCRLLGFDRLLVHGLDGTSSRDFIAQTISTFSILMSNHSKLAEEIVLWSSFEFGLLNIDDAFATGSSIMPQKKNPVVAELAKGRTGRVYGALMQILTTMKGVTTGYNCDLQEDKPMLWDAIDTVLSTTQILNRHILTSRYDSQRAEDLCWKNFSTVTELANYLVKERGLPFREAHRVTGELTQALIAAGKDLRDDATISRLLAEEGININAETLRPIVDPKLVLLRQTSVGGTSPVSAAAIIAMLSDEEKSVRLGTDTDRKKIENAKAFTLTSARKVIQGSPVTDVLAEIAALQ